ncbi:MAG TPA: tol-pal system-associated acyl-CoA thioesterase [Gammaproteobacteria bacterium]|nr:tol-pal system-associated acyl-CoA thioesterase [Gammaproteobacteria bacterium]
MSPDTRFSWPVRVYFEDTDNGGVVYYANYLKFMERARTEWLRARGVEQDRLLEQDRILFVIVSAEIRYRRPARFNDLLNVTAEVAGSTRTSFTFAQDVYRGSPDGELLCHGKTRAACLDADSFRPRPLPESLFAEISR